MANPTLSEKRFEEIKKADEAGWAAPVALARAEATGVAPPPARVSVMTANGAFAKTFLLFLLVVAGGVVGWSQTDLSSTNQVEFPGWSWVALFGAFALAMVCVFKPKLAPIFAPIYALTE